MIWLIQQIDSITFGLTTHLLCIFDICGVSTAVVLVKNDVCSSAHNKISFRTWFSQIFINKSLIKCEKFVSCLMQYSKKYWKWPETYVLILHSYWTPQFQNFAIPPIWLSSHSIWLSTQRHCYPCITFSLHNFKLLPKYPTYFFLR